ncbi:MAG: NAD-dependent epimerase/dehydratase family protein [Anaerolineae bacterium]
MNVPVATGDLMDRASLAAAMRGCEAVIHAAGYYPTKATSHDAHLQMARAMIGNVLSAMRDASVPRLVYTSSISTIGPIPGNRLGTEADYYWPGQRSAPYWDCKWAQEEAVLAAADLHTTALIPSAILGPGDVKPTTGTIVLAVARAPSWITIDGRVNVVDVREVAQAHVAALTSGGPGERYLIGGHNLTISELHRLIAHAVGRRAPLVAIPSWLVGPIGDLALRGAQALHVPGAVSLAYIWQAMSARQWIDSARAQRALGYRPRPIEETIRDTVQWFRERGYFERPLRAL